MDEQPGSTATSGQTAGATPPASNAATSSQAGSGSVSNERLMAGLAYFIFFLPMLMNPRTNFAMFHAKQGLVLLIASILGNIVLGIIPIFGWMLLPFFNLAIIVLVIMGLMNGLNGKEIELPVIGQFASKFTF